MAFGIDSLCDYPCENFPEEKSWFFFIFNFLLTIYGGHNDVTFPLTNRILHQATVISNVFFGHWSNMENVVLGRKGAGGTGMDRSPIF